MIKMKQLEDSGSKKKNDRYSIGSEELANWLEDRKLAERVKTKPAKKADIET